MRLLEKTKRDDVPGASSSAAAAGLHRRTTSSTTKRGRGSVGNHAIMLCTCLASVGDHVRGQQLNELVKFLTDQLIHDVVNQSDDSQSSDDDNAENT